MTYLKQIASISFGLTILMGCTPETPDTPDNENIQSDVAEWISETAVHLSTVEAGNGFDDIRPIGDMIGDARLVGFGEATHGNREIFQLKHRVFEYLVEEKGFTIFALEAPFAEAQDLNDYVLNGNGSAQEALASLTMWAWDTQEVADLLDWIRAYNEDPAHTTKLKVIGFDTQAPERAARLTLDYLDRVDPEFGMLARNELGSIARPFSDPDEFGWRPIRPDETDDASLDMARHVVSMLDENRESYIELSSEDEWSEMRQMALQVQWIIDANSQDGINYDSIRDLGMANNIDWYMERESETAKAFIWAHNSHLGDATLTAWGDLVILGRHLRQRHGDNFVNIAGLIDRGETIAVEAVQEGGVRVFDLPSSGPQFVESRLVEAGLEIALLDMHAIPADGPVHDYFCEPVLTRHSGGGYNVDNAERYRLAYQFPEAFDIIAFVRDNTATRLINDEHYQSVPLISELSNTGFEDLNSDSSLASWFAWSKPIERWGYSVSRSEDAFDGDYAARLCREAGRMSPDVAGSLVQRIDISDLQGENLTIQVNAKLEPESENATAFLRMKIMPPAISSAHDTSIALYDNMDRDLIETSEWTDYSLPVEIPEGAGSLLFGLFLRGEGCALMDEVRWNVSSE